MQMYKTLSSGVLALFLAGCAAAHLPDPSIKYPTPPAVLMEPAQNMKTIPETK